ncbi:MAG: hypothetical protein QM734_14430 [Cyclobacteriaceae bacterium]
MKDSLKDFVNENRERFDSHNAPEGAWEKIIGARPRQPKLMVLNSVSFWRAAALILLGLSSYLLVTKNYAVPNKKEVAEMQGFSDLEMYYSSQISEKMKLISLYEAQVDVDEDEITQNLKKLDAMYLVLKDQLKKRPTQDVRDALVLNFLIRIDLINQQLNKLDRPKDKGMIKS